MITALMLLFSCGVTYAFIAWTTPVTYTIIAAEALSSATEDMVSQMTGESYANAESAITRFTVNTGALVTVITPEGIVDEELSTLVLHENKSVEGEPADSKAITVVTLTDEADASSSFYAVDANETQTYSVSFSDREGEYKLCVSGGVQQVNRTEEALLRVLPGLVVVVLVISLLGAVFYSRYISKPIVQMSSLSQQMAAFDFSHRWQAARQDEIGTLGANLNQLSNNLSSALEQLQDANRSLQEDIDRERERERQRTAFFAAASHELKTPLTVVKGQLSAMLEGIGPYRDRDKYLAKALTVTERMENLIREMLEIARLEPEGLGVSRESIDLTALVRNLIARTDELATLKKQRLTAKLAEGARIDGERVLIERAIGNLLSNAVAYSPDGGEIAVSLTNEESVATLEVVNSGVLIPEEALPHLCEAFYRVEASRSRATGGSGLGLYLANTIFARHGASCDIKNTAGGVSVTVRFSEKKFTKNT